MEALLNKIYELLKTWYDYVLKRPRPIFKKGQCVKLQPGQGNAKQVIINIPAEYADGFTVKIWPGYQFFTANKAEGASPALTAKIENGDGGGSTGNSRLFNLVISSGQLSQENAARALWMTVPAVGGAYRAQGDSVTVSLCLTDDLGAAALTRDVYVSICKGAPEERKHVDRIIKAVGVDNAIGVPLFAKSFRLAIMNNLGTEDFSNIGDLTLASFSQSTLILATNFYHYCEWITSDTLGAPQVQSYLSKEIPLPDQTLALLWQAATQTASAVVLIEWVIFE